MFVYLFMSPKLQTPSATEFATLQWCGRIYIIYYVNLVIHHFVGVATNIKQYLNVLTSNTRY